MTVRKAQPHLCAGYCARNVGTMAMKQHLCPQIAHHSSMHETDQRTGNAVAEQ